MSSPPRPENLPADIPPEAAPFLQEMGYLDADRLRVGDPAPPLTLRALETGAPVAVPDPVAGRPVVLIFGSYT